MKFMKYRNKEREFIGERVEAAKAFSDSVLKGQDGVEAIFLTGSIARGDCEQGKYGYSIDICVVHVDADVGDLLGEFNPTQEGRFFNFNFHELPFTVEPLPRSWMIPYSSELGSKYFALQESILLFDEKGMGKQLLEMKMPEDERKMRIMSNFHQAVYHSNNYRIEKWLRRNNFAQCHLNLSDSLKYILELLYLVNASFVPRDDYMLYFTGELQWLPEGLTEHVDDALKITDMSLADVLRRRKHIAGLIMELKAKIEDDKVCCLALQKPYEKVALNFSDEELPK